MPGGWVVPAKYANKKDIIGLILNWISTLIPQEMLPRQGLGIADHLQQEVTQVAHYKYLIAGGGMTADAAVKGIRKIDRSGTIGIFSVDSDPPYTRPYLSKALWKGRPFEKVWRGTENYGVDLHLNCGLRSLDVQSKQVIDQDGNAHTYEKLLLATGGTPRRLPVNGDSNAILYFRTLNDYRHLRDQAEKGQRFAVIGGGFIGSEITAALAMNGKEVVQFFPEPGIGSAVYPPDISRVLNDYYREKGVAVYPGEKFGGLEKQGEKWIVKTDRGNRFLVDGIVAGIGITPNVELAQGAGLQVENGIVVDEFLRTSSQAIYAAGDVASFYNSVLGKRMRVEHEDNALVMGDIAGQNMAGENLPYHHLPFFYSDLFDMGYEAVGELSSKLETVADWQEPYQKGVIYYLGDGRVRGVLLWNVWGQVDAARKLIAEPGPFDSSSLKGRLGD